jgi:hypothetical protein
MIPQYRLKHGEELIDGKYVKIPQGHTAATKPKTGENPVSFIAQLHNTHTPCNPFMTVTVPSLSNNREEDQRRTQKLRTKGGIGRKKEMTSALIDTGALDSDYVSSRLAKELVDLGYTYDTSQLDSIHTPFTNIPSVACKGHMSLNVKIYNELTKTNEVIPLNARVIDSPIDIIIWRPTITQHKLPNTQFKDYICVGLCG